MLFINFIVSLSLSIPLNLSLSNLVFAKSQVLFANSPVLTPPRLYSSSTIFSTISLSKILISNSFSSFFFISHSNYKNILFQRVHLNSFLAQAVCFLPAECENQINEHTHCFLTKLDIDGCSFTDIRATDCDRQKGSGGAICVIALSDISCTYCNFTNCSAPIRGGAIFVHGFVETTIEHCNFSKCFSAAKPFTGCHRGGSYGATLAFYESKKASISETHFIDNYIFDKDLGAYALYFESSVNVEISICYFNNDISCGFDLAFNMLKISTSDKATYSITSCCFEGKSVFPIEENLTSPIELELTIYNNSFTVKKIFNSLSNLPPGIITDGNFMENDKCLFMAKASSLWPTRSPLPTGSLWPTRSPTPTTSNTFIFTDTQIFTSSSKFSKSILFTDSELFSDSNAFDPTQLFSSTLSFSLTNDFSQTEQFSSTNDFSESIDFSISKNFSQSNIFPQSETFSKSQLFSKTPCFSKTDIFSGSINFTASDPLIIFPEGHGEERGLSKGGIAGIVIACLVLLAIIIILIIFFLHRKKSAFIPPEDDPMNIDGLEIPVNMYE